MKIITIITIYNRYLSPSLRPLLPTLSLSSPFPLEIPPSPLSLVLLESCLIYNEFSPVYLLAASPRRVLPRRRLSPPPPALPCPCHRHHSPRAGPLSLRLVVRCLPRLCLLNLCRATFLGRQRESWHYPGDPFSPSFSCHQKERVLIPRAGLLGNLYYAHKTELRFTNDKHPHPEQTPELT